MVSTSDKEAAEGDSVRARQEGPKLWVCPGELGESKSAVSTRRN